MAILLIIYIILLRLLLVYDAEASAREVFAHPVPWLLPRVGRTLVPMAFLGAWSAYMGAGVLMRPCHLLPIATLVGQNWSLLQLLHRRQLQRFRWHRCLDHSRNLSKMPSAITSKGYEINVVHEILLVLEEGSLPWRGLLDATNGAD